jgi:hypothetical protein
MKFISKNSNLRVVLKPGIPGERLTGRIAESGIYVKFEDGVADVKDENLVKMMMEHPGYDVDYILSDGFDPYKGVRKSLEPEHSVVNIEYGHVGKNINPKSPAGFTPEQLKIIQEMVEAKGKEKAIEILRDLAKEKGSVEEKKPVSKTTAKKAKVAPIKATEPKAIEPEEKQ